MSAQKRRNESPRYPFVGFGWNGEVYGIPERHFKLNEDGSTTPMELVTKPRVKHLDDGLLIYRAEEWEVVE